jgi:very-short-patch-repair endonuclease
MLAIGAASKKRLAAEGVGVKLHNKKAKPKRPRGTKFINFTCELDKDNCIHDQNGLCIAHNTPAGKSKVGCLVNAKVATQLSCGNSKIKVKFKCDVCFHVFSIKLDKVTDGRWCSMCSIKWKHCGVVTCTYCFGRSFESYEGETSKGNKKADYIVDKADLRLALGSGKKVEFECDICLTPFSSTLDNLTLHGSWCPCSKNKTATKVFNYLLKMKFDVVREYIPGGKSGTTSLMKQTYGKNGFMDYHLPGFNIIFELDGVQHNMEVAFFKSASLFTRMILDKWKEFWARKCGLSVIRFDQVAISKDKYDWKQEMENLLTFTSEQLTNQLKETKKRYKMYAKEHNDKSKRRSIPEIVKRSHKKAGTSILF